jgi:hypothetical protein
MHQPMIDEGNVDVLSHIRNYVIFLGIPFFRHDTEVMGMIALANKQSTIKYDDGNGGNIHSTTTIIDFTQHDIEFLEPFTLTAANLVQAYLQIEANEVLMETVKERTRTLECVNHDLELANKRVMEASAAQLKHFVCMSHEIRTPLPNGDFHYQCNGGR